MKKKIFFLASFIVGVVLFIGVLGGIGLDSIFFAFRKLRLNYLLLFFGISVVILLGKTFKWHMILRAHDVKINFGRLLMCKLSGIAISFITPIAMMGGSVAMSYLLSKEKVKAHKAVSSVVLDKSFEIVMILLFTFFGLIVILTTSALNANTVAILLIIPVIFVSIIYFMYDRVKKGKGIFTSLTKVLRLNKAKWFKKYNQMLQESEKSVATFLLKNKKDSLQALLLTALIVSLMLFEYKAIFLALGIDVSWAVVFATIAVVGITYSLPIPAALGALEGGQASLFSSLGLAAGAGFVLGLIIRARDLLWTFIGLIYLAIRGLSLNKKDSIED